MAVFHQMRNDRSVLGLRTTFGQGTVDAVHVAVRKLPLQVILVTGVAGEDHDARSFAIQAVHDVHPSTLTVVGTDMGHAAAVKRVVLHLVRATESRPAGLLTTRMVSSSKSTSSLGPSVSSRARGARLRP